MVADCLFYSIHDLGFKGHQEGVLGDEQLDILLRGEIWLINVPAEHLLVFLTIRLELQVNGYQIFLCLNWPLSFNIQGIGYQVELLVYCLVEGCVSGSA